MKKKDACLTKIKGKIKVKILVPQPVCGNHSPFEQDFLHSLATTEVFTALIHHQTLKNTTSAFLKQRKIFPPGFLEAALGSETCVLPLLKERQSTN